MTWVNRKLLARMAFTTTTDDTIDHQMVGIWLKIQVVADTYRLHKEAKFGRQLLTDAFHTCEQLPTGLGVNQWDQSIPDLKTHEIDLAYVFPVNLLFFLGLRFPFN